MPDCPSQDLLRRFEAGGLDEDSFVKVQAHLDLCEACRDRLQQVEGGSFNKLVDHLKGLDLSGVSFSGSAAGANVEGAHKPDLSIDASVNGASGSGSHSTRAPQDGSVPSAAGPVSEGDRLIPGYRLDGEVHRGGQGVVFEALQLSTKRTVAIKVLLDGHYASAAAQRRFEREVELAASLQHPDIVAVFDSGTTTDGRQYCVMDLVDGVPLDQWLRDKQPDLKHALDLFAHICDAVHYAHQRGVIHRDLKPSNILIRKDGSPTVLDFGLAKQMDDADPLVSVTGQIVGTLPYMSPEQTRGSSGDIDVRTDIYSLGVVLYEVIVGKLPYPIEGSIPDIITNIGSTAPETPRQAWISGKGLKAIGGKANPVDDEVETILLKCLAKERERRYQTALDLARDLRSYLAGEAIEAKRDSSWYIIRKTVKRNRGLVMTAAAFVVMLMAWGAGVYYAYAQETEHSAELETLNEQVTKQRDRALAAETEAKQRFTQVRELAEALLFDIDEKIKDLAGATPAREFIVGKAISYFDTLASDAEGDPIMLRDLFHGYSRIGEIQGGRGLANLGKTDEALASFTRALELAQERYEAFPDEPSAIEDLFDAHILMANTYEMQADMDAWQRHIALAEELIESALAKSPTLDSLRTRQARLYMKIGDRATRRWDLPAAEKAFKKVKALTTALHEDHPDEPKYQRDMSLAESRLTHIKLNDRAEPPAIQVHIDSARELLTDLVERYPDNLTYLRDLTIIEDYQANLYMRQQEFDKALTAFEEGLRLGEKLLAADPKNAQALRDLAVGHNNVGRAAKAAEQFDKAAASHEQAMQISRALIERDPTNAMYARDEGFALVCLAEAHGAASHPTKAIGVFDKAVDTYRLLLETDPNNVGLQRDLLASIDGRGHQHIALGKDETRSTNERIAAYRKGIKDYEEFIAILRKLQAAGKLGESEIPYIESVAQEITEWRAELKQLTDTHDSSE